jgi:hypothetical protein
VALVGNSRGGQAIRNHIQNGGGERAVSHAIPGGVPNHGIRNLAGCNPGSAFAGNGPFMQALDAPKNANGDEVAGPVKWLTLRCDNNDKYAQPHGAWIGAPDQRRAPRHRRPQPADREGRWGSSMAQRAVSYEFVPSTPGSATTHIYRSPLPRSSSNIVNLRPERVAAADQDAPAIVTLTRARVLRRQGEKVVQ